MKIGDLVKYKSPNNRWDHYWDDVGVIVRCISGTDRVKVVHWATGETCSYPERNLELVPQPCDPAPVGAPEHGACK